jgi:acrylyl-CoA reductase (NADPH) / 3-hydroxypropionyl-CoA dehydratase / 3-hydroxypropionyl-CoA synthetase
MHVVEPHRREGGAVDVRSNPIVDRAEWQRQRAHAAQDPGGFHGAIAKREIHWYDADRRAWITFDGTAECWSGWSEVTGEAVVVRELGEGHAPWRRAFDDDDPPVFGWFQGGLTNAAFNEVDRHVLAGHGEETAFIVEGDKWDEDAGEPLVSFAVSRARLLLETVKAALALRSLGLRKGDRVALNMPNIIEQVYYSEAAKRLGIIYTPVFGGFSAKTLSDRIADAGARVVVTADGGYRNGGIVPYKEAYADPALDEHLTRDDAAAIVDRALSESGLRADAARAIVDGLVAVLASEVTVQRGEVLRAVDPALRALGAEGDGARAAIARALDRRPRRVDAVVVVSHTGADVAWHPPRDRWSHELLAAASAILLRATGAASEEELLARSGRELWRVLNDACPVVPLDADWPLFVIYTSGSTGKPKGVVHVHGGYVAGIAHTMRVSFDVAPGRDTIYVIADPGWITGQSYLISAALTTRTTSVLAEGAPLYPTAGRFASIIARYGVTVFKAGVTFLRSVMADPDGRAAVEAHDTSSLRVATFCAEPTSPVVQQFGMDVLCPRYINSYWATEHGGIVWTHFFGTRDLPLRPDTHAYPMPWIFGDVWVAEPDPAAAPASHRRAEDGERGELVIERPYPYLARTIWGAAESLGAPDWAGDRERWRSTYWARWSDALAYTQGDFAVRHPDGSFTFHGRSDDVINVAGHRIGTEEIEGAILRDKVLADDSPVANVVVVGAPHAAKGLTPLAFVQTVGGRELSSDDTRRLADIVRSEKGPVAVPSDFIAVSELPETRSGKYVRRLLAALVSGAAPGDLSALRNPDVLREIEPKVAAWRKNST